MEERDKTQDSFKSLRELVRATLTHRMEEARQLPETDPRKQRVRELDMLLDVLYLMQTAMFQLHGAARNKNEEEAATQSIKAQITMQKALSSLDQFALTQIQTIMGPDDDRA